MTVNGAALLSLFCLMQGAITLLMKYGGSVPGRWWACFAAANVLTMASIGVMMAIYRQMNANSAMGIAVGFSFVVGQAALSLVFKQPVSACQLAGLVCVFAGVLLFCY